MINKKKILAIIPARAGSKRLINKNIKNFHSKPLLFWTINQALNSKYIDKVVISSDSKMYLNLTNKLIKNNSKLETHLRPKSLSKDNTLSESVVKDVVNKFKNFHTIILLQPTSPLRLTKDIDDSLRKYFKNNKKSLVSAYKYTKSKVPFYNLTKQKLYKINLLKYKRLYLVNGSIYIVNNKYFLKNNKILSKNPILFEMPISRSIDIDDNLDFIIAEQLFYENF